MIRFFSKSFLFLLFLSSFLSSEKIPEVHQFIDINAQYFLTLIKEEGSNYKNEPEEFKTKLKNIWEPMVDISTVSRLILADAYKDANRNQIQLFEDRTKKLLLDTYVTTLLEFEDYEIRTNEEIKVNKKTYEVEIEFVSDTSSWTGKTKFTLYRNKLGELKIVNIIIDGINLGLTFRNQFKDILEKNKFDLDNAINEWRPLNITDK